MKGHITCVLCPLGCRISISEENGEYKIEGNRCPRGRQYAIDELVSPKRVLTTNVKVVDGELELVSVKTSGPINKAIIIDKMKEIKRIAVKAPVKVGDVIIEDLDGNGTALLATRNVRRRSE